MIDQKSSHPILRPEWSPEEVALSELLRSGVETSTQRPLPDAEALFLLSLSMGGEAPQQSPLHRVLLSWPFLVGVGFLPIGAWFLQRFRGELRLPSAPLDPALLSAMANRLADAGAPGWEAGAVLLGVFLYLTFEYLLEPPRHT